MDVAQGHPSGLSVSMTFALGQRGTRSDEGLEGNSWVSDKATADGKWEAVSGKR